jgi:biopolymer transport protein ExbD
MKSQPLLVMIALTTVWFGCASLCAEQPAIDPALRQASHDYTNFISEQCSKEIKPDLLQFTLPEATLAEAKKSNDAVVAAAKGRDDIAKAAMLGFEAYRYAVKNLPLRKQERKPPQDPTLAAFMATNQAGITEGQIMKCLLVMHLRLGKFFGESIHTEEQVMANADLDLDAPIPGIAPAPQASDNKTDEAQLKIASDGKLTLDGKLLSGGDLISALKLRKEKAESAGRTLLLTLEGDEETEYKKMEEALDAAAKAGVSNLTFQAPSPK